ncbi:TPA: tyrosine-protein phosphatase [Enterococcus faecalis]
MIDLHCHILPGVDDGPKNTEESLQMANSAISQGITHIVATPHHNDGRFNNPKKEIALHVKKLQQEFESHGIPLTLSTGQEIRITGSLLDDIKKKQIIFLDPIEKYILIEFPTIGPPIYTDQVFFELINMKKKPIIVHPERNNYFREDPFRLIPYLELGCLAQITASSYLGKFGRKTKKISKLMLKMNLVQLIASDAHGINSRPFLIEDCYNQIESDLGIDKVRALKQAATDVLNGYNLEYSAPIDNSKNNFFLCSIIKKKYYI